MGASAVARLEQAVVMVVGLGGVGAYAAEMLARAGTGTLILIDGDTVSLSNCNRQLLGLRPNVGQKKTELMARRIRDINPQVVLRTIDEYLDEQNLNALLDAQTPDFLVDAIDTLSPKAALIAYALQRGWPLVSAMGAGAKMDATAVRIGDISKTFNCPLASALRKRLRKAGIDKGFPAVFSEELPLARPAPVCEGQNGKSQVGSISYLPAVFGCVCAQVAIQNLLNTTLLTNNK